VTILATWIAMLLAIIVPTLVGVAITGRAIRRGRWPSLLWQMPYRPVTTVIVLIAIFAMTLLVAIALFAVQNAVPIGFAVWLIATPLVALPATGFIAWYCDGDDVRAHAAGIRNQRLEAEGSERRVSLGRHWAEYILDVQRTRLRSRYQPPD
jgi:hypothetical protein